MHCLGLHLDNFKDNFLSISIFLHPQIPNFQIVVSRPKKFIEGTMNANMYRDILKQSMIPMIWAQFGHFHLGVYSLLWPAV